MQVDTFVRPNEPTNSAGRTIRSEFWQRRDDVLLLIDVVAERHGIDSIRADFVEQVLGDTAAAGDVLGIGDDEIDLLLRAPAAGNFWQTTCRPWPADGYHRDIKSVVACSSGV